MWWNPLVRIQQRLSSQITDCIVPFFNIFVCSVTCLYGLETQQPSPFFGGGGPVFSISHTGQHDRLPILFDESSVADKTPEVPHPDHVIHPTLQSLIQGLDAIQLPVDLTRLSGTGDQPTACPRGQIGQFRQPTCIEHLLRLGPGMSLQQSCQN